MESHSDVTETPEQTTMSSTGMEQLKGVYMIPLSQLLRLWSQHQEIDSTNELKEILYAEYAHESLVSNYNLKTWNDCSTLPTACISYTWQSSIKANLKSVINILHVYEILPKVGVHSLIFIHCMCSSVKCTASWTLSHWTKIRMFSLCFRVVANTSTRTVIITLS